MGIELRLLDDEGTEVKVLPAVEGLNLSPVLCDSGTLEFSYPSDGENWEFVKGRDEFRVAVYLDGERVSDLDAVVKDSDGDEAAENAVWKYTGFFETGRLMEAQTHPAGWPSSVDPQNPNLRFSQDTAGTIMGTLMQQAHARGTLEDIDFSSFSSTHDSNGVPWNKIISIEYAPQVDYLTAFRNLYGQGMVEFTVSGGSLRAYVAGSMTVDHTLDDPPLVFRRGRDLSDSPRKTSSRGVVTAFLAAGADGLYREVTDPEQIAARRRIEGGDSQGSVSDEGTLLAYAQYQLQGVSRSKMEKTHGLSFGDPATPRPIRNFMVGDWAYSDVGEGVERLRIKQWVFKLETDGTLSGSVTLNDFFAEQKEVLARRVQGIVGGTTITGGSRAVNVVTDDMVDGVAPLTPDALSLTSSAYLSPADGRTLAQVTATWAQVTANADGTICDDLARYALQYRFPDIDQFHWYYLAGTEATTQSWSGLPPGVRIETKVRAEDKAGNVSPWSVSQFISSGTDTTPPPVASTPMTDNYLGLFRVQWDGTFLDDAPRPSDFLRVNVYMSEIAEFTLDQADRVGSLGAKGSLFLDVPYGAVRYVRFVSEDQSHNVSDPSATSAATSTSQILSEDIFRGAVGSEQLAYAAVKTANIDDLAVNDAKIGSLSVGKLTAGIMNAEVQIGGRFATALTGARTEMNSLGIYRYNAAGVAIVAIDDSGALLTGRYKTAIDGRRIEMGAAGSTGRIDFWSPDGRNAFVQAWTQSNGVEAIQFGLQVPGWTSTLWNRINYNWSTNGEYATYKSGTHEFTYDSTAPNTVGRFVIYQGVNRDTAGGSARLQIDATNALWVHGNPQTSTPRLELRASDGYMVHGTNIDGVYQEYRQSGSVGFTYGANGGSLQFEPQGGNGSPQMRFFTGTGYGTHLKCYSDSRGVWQEVRGWDDGGYYGIRAANFEVNSDEREKRSIRPAGIDSYLAHMTAEPRRFRRKGNLRSAHKGVKALARQEELGLIAQELPEGVRLGNEEEGYGYGQSQMNAFLWGALREMKRRVEDLENGDST